MGFTFHKVAFVNKNACEAAAAITITLQSGSLYYLL